jgi:hypothetical protein
LVAVHSHHRIQEEPMPDLLLILLVIAFFGLSWGFVRLSEEL